jgi:uncharacterized membrane protein (UPF0136 family)
MKKSMLVLLPTEVLWGFREFKRDEVATPKIYFVPTHNVDEIADYINEKGEVEPVELSVIGNRALLTDGNHRIVAAKRLGFKMIPVNVVVFFGARESLYPFYNHTLKKFKPISQHLELWLKRIFLYKGKCPPQTSLSKELLYCLNFDQFFNLN